MLTLMTILGVALLTFDIKRAFLSPDSKANHLKHPRLFVVYTSILALLTLLMAVSSLVGFVSVGLAAAYLTYDAKQRLLISQESRTSLPEE